MKDKESARRRDTVELDKNDALLLNAKEQKFKTLDQLQAEKAAKERAKQNKIVQDKELMQDLIFLKRIQDDEEDQQLEEDEKS